MHWVLVFNGTPSRIGRGSLLNHWWRVKSGGGFIFAMEIEIVPVCKPHWNVLPEEMARIVLLGTPGVVCDTCVDFSTWSMYQVGPRHVTDHRKTCIPRTSNISTGFRLRPELWNRSLDVDSVPETSCQVILISSRSINLSREVLSYVKILFVLCMYDGYAN